MIRNQFLMIGLALILGLAALFGAVQGGAAQNETLVVSISAPSALSAAQDVTVEVTISNPTNHPQKILKWFTPVDDIEESLFSVSLAGKTVAYLGPVYKRPAVKGDDYLNLKAGETRSWPVNLSAVYDFSASGSYTLQFDVSGYQLRGEKSASFERLTSNSIQVSVEGRAPAAPAGITPAAVTGTTSYNKCTTSQKTALISARSQASTYSSEALAYLNAKKDGARYTTWFGVNDPGRYTTVTTHFSAISSAMDTAPVTFDCGCKKNYYAYVYPTRPYNIYLCKVFWLAPLTGTDSQAGTLIHEMSHFKVVASTNDYVYGQTGAQNLAISNPTQAINNADNHEYFAENTPTLP